MRAETMTVSITRTAYRKLMLFPKLVESEIGGLCRVVQDGIGFHVSDTVLLRQQVSGVHVDLDMDALSEFVGMVDDPSEYRSWWHSHYSFGVGWSGTDENTIDRLGISMPYLLSICVNQAGDMVARLDIFKPFRAMVPVSLLILDDKEDPLREKLEREVAEKVARPAPRMEQPLWRHSTSGSIIKNREDLPPFPLRRYPSSSLQEQLKKTRTALTSSLQEQLEIRSTSFSEERGELIRKPKTAIRKGAKKSGLPKAKRAVRPAQVSKPSDDRRGGGDRKPNRNSARKTGTKRPAAGGRRSSK